MEVCTPSLSIVMDWDPASGTGNSLITPFPLFCNDFQNHKLLNSCSCKAAAFKAEDSSFLVGDCQLLSQNFSLITSPIRSRGYNYIAYIKVHDVQDFKPPSDDDRKSHLIIVAGTVGADGTIAWSTNISNKVVAGLNFTKIGNLVILDENNASIWQSFDHPTDVLLHDQELVPGQNLTSIDGGLFSLSVTRKGLFAFIQNSPHPYFVKQEYGNDLINVKFVRGEGLRVIFTSKGKKQVYSLPIPQVWSSIQYLRYCPDGHLRAYEWKYGFQPVYDILSLYLNFCNYPMACGSYGLCTNTSQCICPQSKATTNYFRQRNNLDPTSGCSLIVPTLWLYLCKSFAL